MNDDTLDLPAFLDHRKGENPPPAEGGSHPTKKSTPPSRTGGGLDKIASLGAVMLGTEEKWRQYEAAQREQRLRKSRGRVGKMLAAGKRWDVKTGRWV